MCPPVAGRMIDSKQCSAMFSIMWKQWNQARGDDGSKERDWAPAPNNMLCNKATVTSEVWGRPRAFVIYHWNMNDRQMAFLIFVFLCISRHSRSFHNLITPQKWNRISLSTAGLFLSYLTSRCLWTHRSAHLEVSAKFFAAEHDGNLEQHELKAALCPCGVDELSSFFLFALCFHETLSCVEFGGFFKTSTAS